MNGMKRVKDDVWFVLCGNEFKKILEIRLIKNKHCLEHNPDQPIYHELLELAASFQSTSGNPVTKYLSIARRVRSSLRIADMPSFVYAFCQSNCGNVSPNVCNPPGNVDHICSTAILGAMKLLLKQSPLISSSRRLVS
ncbi:hypothetical protein L1987_35217 [Smallanthus sonchifolius]|uniref:Uncharacterized protein n=1 Tax=Smallanthus sonchifolius TaxID=185202 RepID=A0ACB9HVR3_9ASTR|nr:hypothetical protein L1987_35217 [Smallanthus sonchifolius]